MSHWIKWSAICVGLALLAGASENVPLDKVPDDIMTTIKERFAEPELVSVEKYDEDGENYFDVELKDKGTTFSLDLQEDGTLLQVDKTIDVKDLPEACASAVAAKYPKATITDVMVVHEVEDKVETLERYDVTITMPDKSTLELEVSPDGKSVTEDDSQ